jgi:hypothetical protein
MQSGSQVRFKARALTASVAAVATTLALALGSARVGAAEAPATVVPHEIRDPYYGDALFHFFQAHYFTSVTTLMASQHFNRVSRHAEEAEVLRGGLLLSYGLHREAGEIFARLIEKGATPAVRDRAWFYLAKIRYQRGYLAEAEEAIGRIGTALPPELQEERGLLQANLLMARADYAGAAAALGAMDLKAPGARFVRFNLGIALMKGGDPARGTAVLDELGRSPAENEEQRALRDRANVALGFSALAENQPQAARNYLERVRLKSLQANKALLGFGWAAAAMKKPDLALVPWLELAQRDVSDSAVLEAQIAVPYAYAELGAYGQSATRYNEAIAAFARENAGLGESINAIRAGKLIETLVESNPGEEMGWFWSLRDLPEMPHAAHLAHVLAQHEFQEAFKNYRDLRFLTRNLEEWRDKLGVFDDMLATRRKAFADRLPQIRARASEGGIEPLRKRFEAVTGEVSAGEAAADGLAFADARQIDLLARVASARATVGTGAGNPDIAAAVDRVRLTSGALTWQLAQDYSGRVWSAKKELQAIAAELDRAKRLDAALAQVQRDEPARFDAFARRVAALAPLLQALIPRVAALSKEQQQAVQGIAVAELTRQQERLAIYSTQARFAVAQLYDRGTDRSNDRVPDVYAPSKEADRATKP